MSASATASLTLENYRTQVKSGKHEIIVDEPESLGGKDTGMQPNELLAGSLASCTAITLKMYLDRKELDISDIQVNVELTQTESGENVFKRSISIEPKLEENLEKRALNVANKCPVHKLLEGSVLIETTIS